MRIAVIVELIGIAVVGAGIGLELATRADLYHVFLTSGALIVSAGGVYFAKTVKR